MHTHTPPAVRLTIVEAIGPFVIIELGKGPNPARYYVENRDTVPAPRVNPTFVNFEAARELAKGI